MKVGASAAYTSGTSGSKGAATCAPSICCIIGTVGSRLERLGMVLTAIGEAGGTRPCALEFVLDDLASWQNASQPLRSR